MRIVPVPGIPPLAELGGKSSPEVSLMSISPKNFPKNWDLGPFSPLFSGIMWNSGGFGLNLVGKIPNFPQGSQRGRALGSSRNSFFPSSPKLFECSRNSLPWKSLWSGGGFSQGFWDPHLFFWEIFLFPSEENPWMFWDFHLPPLWESQDLLRIPHLELNLIISVDFWEVESPNSPFPGVSTSI